MTSNSEIERKSIRDFEQQGVFKQAEFKCPECGGKSIRGTRDKSKCFECVLKDRAKAKKEFGL